MLLSLLLLAVGLALLIGGADLLVRGVSALAAALGVPSIVIGMTVVAFGTSTPEVVVNTMSAIGGETGLAFGNIVGANCLNIGFVLALVAILRPLSVDSTVITRELPMMLLAMAAMLVMSEDRVLDGAPADVLNRADGLIFLLLFGVFLYYTVMQFVRGGRADALVEEIREESPQRLRKRPLWIPGVFVLIGLVGVGAGGRMTVTGAIDLARALGISEVIIGLTLVSFGTTLPELTTSVLAARRGHGDIAIGNVIGSCIFNILFIGGVVGMIHPIEIPAAGRWDLMLMLFLGVVLLPMAGIGARRLSRGEGAFLLIAYLAYFIYRTASAVSTASPAS